MNPTVIKGLELEAHLLKQGRHSETRYVDLRDQYAIAALPEILAQKDVHVEHERKKRSVAGLPNR